MAKIFRIFQSTIPLVALSCCFAVSSSQSAAAQTTVTLSSTIETQGIDRPGINLGGLAGYGSQQLFKSLDYVNGGYFPGTYAATTYSCSQGGTNSTTSWYNNITNSSGFPANFWAGATFVAINTAAGTSYGSGTVTASTSNTGGSGSTFTLSPAISSPCNPSQNDVLIVRLLQKNTLVSPYQELNGHICSNAAWNTTDTSPASTNTQQSLEIAGGCVASFYMDATVTNRTNPNPGLASQPINALNLNGSYTATFKAKCAAAGCSLNFGLGRTNGTTYVGNTTVNPSYSSTQGQGWTTYTYPFNASETGPPGQNLVFGFTCTGTCLMQDVDVIEGSTLPGNTTAFRDAVVYELQKIHPGSIRFMDPSQWCSDVADEIAPTGNRRWCGVSQYGPGGVGQAMGYNDVLALANFIGSDVLISVGQLNQPSDWTTLINWLSTSGWISTYAATGHTIYLEDGNEAWNSAASGSLSNGVGPAYGYTLGANMAAARAAAGYNSSVIKLVGDSFAAGGEGYGTLGWVQGVLTVAQRTTNGLPDFVDVAPYMLNYLGNFDTSGSNVSTTGAPFLDEWAENANIDSVTSPPPYTQSMYLNQQYVKSTFGVNTLVYEVNESTNSGVVATQSQLDQIDASVGNALATAEHVLLMQRDSQVPGPIHVFTLAEPYTGYGCNGCNGQVMPLWGANLFMATGPWQTPGAANVDRPLAIALQVVNNAIGSNNNLMSVSQAGTPTFSYPGGQAGTILSNSSIPYVNCFAYSDGQGDWTTICFNNNLTTAETVNLAGAGAPTGSVSETVFPGPSNVITDNNESIYLGASSIAPVVASPSTTTANGTTYSIPPASFITLTYNVSGKPTLAPPAFSLGAGTYLGAQSVTISFTAGSTVCVGIDTTPTAPSPGTCGAGGTTYAGPITVNASEIVNAIATEAGFSTSAVSTAGYTITTTLPAPTFTPGTGSYSSAQPVTISATPGATIYYTTDSTTPTTSSSAYSGAITVSASETLEAIAAKAGYTTSAVASAVYTIAIGLPPTVSTSCYQGSGASSLTIGPLNTTGANAIAIAVASFSVISTVTDNMGNGNAKALTAAPGGSPSNQLFYWQVPNVGSGHTFTISGGPLYASACVYVMSNVSGTYSGPQSASSAGYGSASCQAGSITPASGPQVIIAGFGVYGPSGAPTLDSSYTLGAYQGGTPGVAFGEATGYIIQSAGAATNPKWNWSNGATSPSCVIAAFGGGTAGPKVVAPTFSPAGGSYNGSQSVMINETTPGTTIYYTTNGTMPTTSSSVYSGGTVTVSASETLEAIAVETGYTGSAPATAVYTIVQPLPMPTFLPVAGTYTTPQSVGISDTISGTTIYYTTNGTTPTTSSSVYNGPIAVSASETLQAIAVETGYTNSLAGTAAYTIAPVLPTPTFSPIAGTYTTAQPVTINATPGTTIYYTTNGTTPTTSSTVYSGGTIAVSTSETLEAIAVEAGFTTSATGTAAYTISTVLSAPSFSPVAGPYTIPQPSTSADYGLHIHGDSISVPLGAGCSTASLCYDALLDAEVGWNTSANANDASSGDESEDMNVKVFTHENPTATNNPIQTTLIGTNDVLVVGSTTGYLTSFAQVQAATHAWLALASTDKIAGSTASVTGTCSNDTTYPTITGEQCTSSGSTVTWSNVVSPNGIIYLWYRAFEVSLGTATCTVDSSPAIDTLTSSATLTGKAIVGLPSGHSIHDDVQLARFAGYSTTSPHTVVCIGTNPFSYLGLGLPPATWYPGLYSPKVAMGGVVYQEDDTSSALTAAYNNQSASIAAMLSSDNLNVIWFNPRLYVDAVCDMGTPRTIGCPESNSPPVHPSNVGHRQLANGFETTLNILTTPASLAVTMSDTASGTAIYYTTDGSTPTAASTLYTGPIRATAAQTLQAIAIETGNTPSPVASASYTLNQGLAAPTFSPAAGTYPTSQPVTISAAAGTTIYYTTNGTTPTTTSSVYGSPITVSSTETLNAIAAESGLTTSSAGSAAYTIAPQLSTPTFSPGAGTYTTSQPVTISAAAGTTIYYTTNGSTPTTSSSVYGGPITVSSTETLNALAAENGFTTSTVGSAAYTIALVLSPPTFSPAGGAYTPSQPSTAADFGLHIHGDSISVPSGFGCNDSANCYDGLLDTEVGFNRSANSNDSNGGDQSEDMNVRVFNDENPTVTNNALQTTLIGTNDALYIGAATNYLTAFAQVQAATHAWLALPNTSKIAGNLGSVSGTCTADTTYPNITGEQCTASNSTVTWSNVAAPGGIIYLWYRALQTSTGTAVCTVDSTPATDTLTSSTTIAAQVLAGMPTNHSLTNDVQLARFAGYSSSSPHTIVCTNSNTFTYVGLGLPPAIRNSALYSPTVAMGGVIYYQNDGNSAVTAALNNQSSIVASTLYGDGLNVLWFNPRLYMDSVCDMGALGTPGCPASTSPPYHPANVGHRQLANGFETTLNVLTTPASVPVSMSDASSGATIYYTTDGSTPTTSSTIYTGPIRVSGSETLQAIAVESGYSTSSAATATYTISAVLAAPTFSLAPGTYTTSQPVTISDATAGTTIYYTTNGTTPTTSSSVYGGAITVSVSETLEAIAVKAGYNTSAAATAVYAINPILSTPTYSPVGGTYTTSQPVTISAAASTTIYYTTNGTTPTTSSSVYGGPIAVSSTETLNAIAVETGYTTSPTATAAYTISPVLSAPTFSPVGGTYTTSQPVTISAAAGTTIYYTTNGTTPTASSSVYGGAITVPASETLEAIAVKAGFTTSAASTAVYTISTGGAGGAPTVSTSCYQGSSASSLTLGPINTTGANAIAIVVASFDVISSVTDNKGNGNATGLIAGFGGSPHEQLFYWQNPTVGGAHTFTVNGNSGLYASACVFVMSGVSGTYSGVQNASSAGYGSSTCQAGTITPPSGPQVIVAGFGVYTPSGVPTLDSSYTAGAYQAGVAGSAYGEATGYIIQPSGATTNPKWNWGNNATTPGCVIAAFGGGTGVPTAATPTFSPVGGTYTTSQPVTISAAAGTTIYYTTNGTAPTTSSSVYGGAITVSSTETLNAIAVETGYTTSPTATASYTINPVLSTPTFSPVGGTYTTSQPVTISATAGTTIYYTTNGTTPTTSSSVYGGAITVSSTETLNAIAVEAGFTTSPTATAAYTISPVLSAPTFSPVGGTYTTLQSVTISAIAGATIYYTTNGTTPTASSSVYGGPIVVSSTETLNAIAVETGYTTSPTATAAYAISPVLSAPTFSPVGGTYTTSQPVTISAAAGTTIYYTTNGTTPTTSSNVYGGPITVSSSQTVNAIAAETGYTTSTVGSAAYTINPLVTGPSVTTSCYQGSSSSSLTLGPINTTGANVIAIVVASFNVISSVTDNKGNGNATGLIGAPGSSPSNQLFYWQNPTVGGAHTFTVNGNSGLYASACVFVMSGITGTYSGAQSANSASYGSPTCQAGSITPGSGQQIVIAGFGVYTPTGIPTLDSLYTVGAYQAGVAGSAYGEATGYIIQTSGAATNPKWNWGNNATTPGCVTAAFK
jgi:arginine exporter protein ArgO